MTSFHLTRRMRLKIFSFDNKSILRNCVSVYLIFIGLLITLSLTPQLRNLYINKGRKKKSGSEQDGKGLINDSGDEENPNDKGV